MTKFSRIYWMTGAILAAGIAQSAGATMVQDNYVGASGGGVDVLGEPSQFQISSMDIDQSGSTLNVKIYTNFVGTAGTNFGGDNTNPDITNGLGIGYGDLFLSSEWKPFGTSPYASDNSETGTKWEYGLAMDDDDRYSNDGGDLTLYKLDTSTNNNTTNDLNARLSDEFITSGVSSYRNGQEVAVDTASMTTSVVQVNNNDVTGTWTTGNDGNGDYIKFSINLSGTDLGGTNFAFHWAMTCANDVIEGVPAPVILLLMATGLIGVGVSTAVRRKRA